MPGASRLRGGGIALLVLAALLAGAAPARGAGREVACASPVPANLLVVLNRSAGMGAPAGSAVPDLDGDGARTKYDLALGVLFRLLNADGGRIGGDAIPPQAGAVPRFRSLITVKDELLLSARAGVLLLDGSAAPVRGLGAPFRVEAPPKTPNVPPYGDWSYRAVWDRAYALGPPGRAGGTRHAASLLRDSIADYFSEAVSVPWPDPFSACRARIVVFISDGSEFSGVEDGEPLLDGSYRLFGLFVGVSREADRARLRRLLGGAGGPDRVAFFDDPADLGRPAVFAALAAGAVSGPWKGADPVVPPLRDARSSRIFVAALGTGDGSGGPVTESLRSLPLSPEGVPIESGPAGWDAASERARRPRTSRKAYASSGPAPTRELPASDSADGGALPALLGSTPVLVGPPSPYYPDEADPAARNAFVLRHARRQRVLLAATEGGTLHAFDAGSWDPRAEPPGYGPGTATEQWTSVPPLAAPGREAGAFRADLREGYGDGSATAADIRVDAPSGSREGGGPGWRTYAFGGAGKGGRAYYALDITDPGSTGYPLRVWELSKRDAPRLGATWSTPAIGRIRSGGRKGAESAAAAARWVAVVGAGKARPAGATVLSRGADLRRPEAVPGTLAVESTEGAPEAGQVSLAYPALEREGGRWAARTYRATAAYSGTSATAFLNVVFRGNFDRKAYPAAVTLVSWSDPADEGRAILVLDAATGGVLQELTHPDMGEVVAAPTLVTDASGHIDRVYVGDLSGNMWRATVDPAGTFDLGAGPFFSVSGEGHAKGIFSKAAVAAGEEPYPRLWVHFGTGDRENPAGSPRGAVFALYDDLPAGSIPHPGAAPRTERSLADATGFFTRIAERDARFPDLDGAYGWYARLPARGEKALSPPRIFHGSLFFTTFQPGEERCPGEGTGRVYGLGAMPGRNLGQPALPGHGATAEATGSAALSRVRQVRGGGIPSAAVPSMGTSAGATLYVGSADGTVESLNIPGPGSAKSIRHWKDVGRRDGEADR